MRVCDIDGCQGKHLAKGFCSKHYLRLYKNGTLKPLVLRSVGVYERLMSKISYEGDCWIFQGCKTANGYGHIRDGKKMKLAHRVSYENRYSPVPHHLELDHLCRNRACVNPVHLELVTHKENVRRGNAGMNYKERTRNAKGQFTKDTGLI